VTAEGIPSTAHLVRVGGLRLGQRYTIRARHGERVLFERIVKTPDAMVLGAGLFRALESVDPWGLLGAVRVELRNLPQKERSTQGPRWKEVLERFARSVERRARSSRLDEALAAFEPIRDTFFSSPDVSIDDKVALYRKIEEARELEMAGAARGLRLPNVAARASSPHFGLSPGPLLERPRAVTTEWRKGSSTLWVRDLGAELRHGTVADDPGTVLPALAEGDDHLERLYGWMDLRKTPFEPGVDPPKEISTFQAWRSDPPHPLPLPEPATVEAAELHAVVEGLLTENAFRVFLKTASRPRWYAIADLRPARGGAHVIEPIWHGLDPRLLAPGALLRLELIYFTEGSSSEQSGRIRFVSFRWKPKSGASPGPTRATASPGEGPGRPH
jgi:hypothetical protein